MQWIDVVLFNLNGLPAAAAISPAQAKFILCSDIYFLIRMLDIYLVDDLGPIQFFRFIRGPFLFFLQI